MATINGRSCVVNGTPVDKVFSDGRQVYGRNLLTGTSKELKTINLSGWGKSPSSKPSGKYGAGRYYASAYVENTTSAPMNIYVSIYADGKFSHNVSGEDIPAGQIGVTSFTFNVNEGDVIGSAFVGFSSSQTESYTYKYKEMMIKRTPMPWTPAPEDVQLKADVGALKPAE